ncbi:MAG TPA: NADH-quinone oxidoreductase subunit J [Methylophilus sp.]|uniref:NADH-quinone oxidoreductase subunit J n=1 Tax=Methylophilus sp. TaxID=29541 RepID=UPI002CF521FB|nr:NADH-quinone oxidoreductase subunit J [Methylophilus sp.]HSH86599.1 NADH-quinone oxidoreductase subunit J [Methylophilus sp.]
MVFTDIVFYVLAAILLFSGIRVITTRNPVHAALFLVLSFFTAAGIWLLLEAEFLAIALILVYVGAVMVLFLFVVMMLDINLDKLREGFWEYLPMAGFIGVLMVVEMTLVLADKNLQPSQAVELPANYSNTAALGKVLYTDYLLPFELAAVVLLVAMIAAIVLTLRERQDNKSMNPSEQVKVKRNDRLRIVSMPAEVEPPEQAPAPVAEEKK